MFYYSTNLHFFGEKSYICVRANPNKYDTNIHFKENHGSVLLYYAFHNCQCCHKICNIQNKT